MPKIKFTQQAIDRLPAPDPSGKQTLYWEIGGNGFAVLVSGVSTAKTYIVERKLPGQLTRRITVGPANKLKLMDTTGTGPDGKKVTVLGSRTLAGQLIGEMAAGIDPKAKRREAARRGMTLQVALEGYLTARKNLSDSSRFGYRSAIERYLADWRNLPLREITPDMVEKRHTDIATEVKKRAAASVEKTKRGDRRGGGPTTGASTANGVMRALRAIWYWTAERDTTLPPNPVRRLKRAWYPEQSRERHLSGDQLPSFYKAVLDLPRTARDYVLFVLFTGLRRTSAAALRWEQVDFSAGVIRLPRKQMKGGKRGLDLPMTDFVRDLLVARRALGNDGGWVFGADSRSGHLEEPKSAFEEIAEITAIATARVAGIQVDEDDVSAEIVEKYGITISTHDLRRTYATHAEETDISVMALKALVNHAIGGNGNITEDYVRMTVARLREPAQRVCDRLKQLCGIIEITEGVTRLKN